MGARWAGILALIGGALLLVGPLLDSFTTTGEIGAMVMEKKIVWVREYSLIYLSLLGGLLALVVGALVVWKPKLVWWGRMVLVLSVLLASFGLILGELQAGEDIGLNSLKAGLSTGHGFGQGGTAFQDLPAPTFSIGLELGSYLLMVGLVLVALAIPWCPREERKAGRGG